MTAVASFTIIVMVKPIRGDKKMLNKFKPDMTASGLVEIDLKGLKREGFRGIIIDIDNTIMPYSSREIPGDIRKWIEKALGMNFNICFVSNTIRERAEYVEKLFGVQVLSQSLKPLKRSFYRARDMFELTDDSMVVVGDQIFTDILGGNLAGFYTILVPPLEDKDFIVTRIMRRMERLFR